MSVSRTQQCDRCGAAIALGQGHTFVLSAADEAPRGRLHNGLLCHDCARAMGQFIKGAEVMTRAEGGTSAGAAPVGTEPGPRGREG